MGADWWETMFVALGAALVGGAASTIGSRWATTEDLRERNRHALLMEDLPNFKRALEAVEIKPNSHTRDAVVRACQQIEVRTLLLSRPEAVAGRAVVEAIDLVAQKAWEPGWNRSVEAAVEQVRDVAKAQLEARWKSVSRIDRLRRHR